MSGENIVADLGYRGKYKARTGLDAKDKPHKRVMPKIRTRHETVNRSLKQFRCLGDKYFCDRKKHALVFETSVVLTHISFDLGDIPFQVNT